jgi:uncharacterized membrane protein
VSVPALIDRIVSGLTITSAVGAGLMGGLLVAFATSVLPALRKQPAASPIATMQSANITILNPLFLLLFVGTTAACDLLACMAPFTHTGAPLIRDAGAIVFVVGCVAVTVAINVPMNNTLAGSDPSTPGAAAHWVTYLHRWTGGTTCGRAPRCWRATPSRSRPPADGLTSQGQTEPATPRSRGSLSSLRGWVLALSPR